MESKASALETAKAELEKQLEAAHSETAASSSKVGGEDHFLLWI